MVTSSAVVPVTRHTLLKSVCTAQYWPLAFESVPHETLVGELEITLNDVPLLVLLKIPAPLLAHHIVLEPSKAQPIVA